MRAQICRELVRRIVEGAYRPGERLVELHVAREFNTSQAPVREAFRELEALRLVESETYRGTRVRASSELEQQEAAAVRGVLEQAAANAATGSLGPDPSRLRAEVDALHEAARAGDVDSYARHNTAFHRLIVEAAGNAVLLRVWDSLMLEARTRINLGRFSPDLHAAADTHLPIVEAFERGDAERAGALLVEHAAMFAAGRGPDGPPAPPAVPSP